MPIDAGEFLSEFGILSAETIGLYLKLVFAWWRAGAPLNYTDQEFAQVTGLLSVRKWRARRQRVQPFFDITPNGWVPKPQKWMRFWRGERRLLPRDPKEFPPNWAALRSSVFSRDDYTCRYCKKHGGALECDHVVPRSRGGSDGEDNLVTACRPCNRAKLDRTPEEMGWTL